ncbi:MAG: hypothetical protein PHU28_04260 [Methanosarcinaceae archaeon]|nr:hypothetical protein [Methanosarcinaceae archaeon]
MYKNIFIKYARTQIAIKVIEGLSNTESFIFAGKLPLDPDNVLDCVLL